MIKVFSIAVISTVSYALIKKYSPEYTLIAELAAVILVILLAYPYLCDLLDLINDYSNDIGIDSAYIKIILKALGIALVTQLTTDMCKDAGENALATKTEFAGKILMLSTSIPMIKALIELTVKIIDAS